jgi:serine/threonine protein kinase
MSQNTSNKAEFMPPVSTFTGPIAELVGHGMLSPPSRPGLLATLDRFDILRILGGGGMGVVLLGRNSSTDQMVAIKMVKPDLVADTQVTHLFVKEAGHMQKLRHVNIMPVLEVSDRAQGPYFVMPYFEQGSLARRIQPGQPLDTGTILDVSSQIAEGLQFAHRRGIIHRDLKPANILEAANGRACLADFGLARTVFNDTLVDVERQHCEGTAPYMSPAVAAGNAEDTRCDIYAFGALLYEMLTGEPPYKGESSKEIRRQIVAGPPKSITAINPVADPGLVAVAEAAMGRELRDRYADMADVLTDLKRVREGEPPIGPHGAGQGGKISANVWLVICLAAVAIAGWWFWQNEKPKSTVTHLQTPTVSTNTQTQPVVASTNVPQSIVATNSPQVVVKTNPVVVTPTPAPARGTFTFSTLAGLAGAKGSIDDSGTNARFNVPSAIAVDGSGNIYVADTANNTIRSITPDGEVATLAGLAGSSGSIDGDGPDARFLGPFGIATDSDGNVYVADMANDTIRKVTPNGVVSTLAGVPKYPGSNDGTGDNARFRNPWSVAVDTVGNVYVADSSNDTIRKIGPGGMVTTLAGVAGKAGSADGTGAKARFWNPHGVAVDTAGNVYVSDTSNNTIRKITPGGLVTTLAGFPGVPGNIDGVGARARFSSPQALSVDGAGNLFVADADNSVIRKITPAGVVSTVAGRTGVPAGAGVGARFSHPAGVALDSAGNLYIADTGNHAIRKGTTR